MDLYRSMRNSKHTHRAHTHVVNIESFLLIGGRCRNLKRCSESVLDACPATEAAFLATELPTESASAHDDALFHWFSQCLECVSQRSGRRAIQHWLLKNASLLAVCKVFYRLKFCSLTDYWVGVYVEEVVLMITDVLYSHCKLYSAFLSV